MLFCGANLPTFSSYGRSKEESTNRVTVQAYRYIRELISREQNIDPIANYFFKTKHMKESEEANQ